MKTIPAPAQKSIRTTAIHDIALGFQKSRILFTACELDIFTIIGNQWVTAAEISEILGADDRSMERLCNALVSLEILRKEGSAFSNTVESLLHLVKGSPDYLTNMIHLASLWEPWSNLTEVVRRGEPVNFETLNEKSEEWIESFIYSSNWKLGQSAAEIVRIVGASAAKKILDLGAGSGAYAIEFARQNPHSQVACFDLPKVIPYTLANVANAGFEGRVTAIAGDFMKDDIGGDYDLIFVSNVVSLFSIWENITLMQKLFDALKRGGRIVINDVIIEDNRSEPLESALWSINMMVNTQSGDAYTETDLWIALKEAWFHDLHRLNTNYNTSLIIGTK